MRPAASKLLRNVARARVFLVTSLVNIRYLTGVDISTGLLFVKPTGYVLFLDDRYSEAARKEVYRGIAVLDRARFRPILGRIRRCGFEADHVTIAQLVRWRSAFKNTKFVQTSGLVEQFRRVKTLDEIRKFRRAQKMTQLLMRRVPQALKSGMTEKDLAWKFHGWARALGADSLSFDPIVAFGTHTSRPHHHPTSQKLRARDIVQIDVGARYQGYCADQSAVFFVGRPKLEWTIAYRVVEEAKRAAIAAVRAGITNHELDRVARNVLRKHHMEKAFLHSLGHGVGLEIHEGPTLSQKASKQKLLKDEIVTIEPGVYFSGKFGIRLEEEIIVG